MTVVITQGGHVTWPIFFLPLAFFKLFCVAFRMSKQQLSLVVKTQAVLT